MRYLKAATALLGVSVSSQLLALLALPLLTRTLSTAEFGQFSVFVATLGLLTPWLMLNLPQALVLTRRVSQQRYISALSLRTAAVSCLFSGLLLIVFVASGLAAAPLLWLLLPLLLWLTALSQLFQQRLLAEKSFSRLASAELRQSLLLNIGKVLVALLLPFATSLAVVTIWARWLFARQLQQACAERASSQRSDAGVWPLNYRHLSDGYLQYCNTRRLSRTARQLWRGWCRYRDFTLYQSAQQGLNALSQHSPLILLSWFQGPAVAAFYMLAKTVLEAPASLVNKAVADIFYPFAAERHHTAKPLLPLLSKVTLALAVLALLPFGLLFFYAPALFGWIFGAGWQQAGELASLMSLWFYLVFCNAPAGRVLVVCRLQRLALWLNVATTSLRLAGLLACLISGQPLYYAIAWLVALGVLHNGVYIGLALHAAWRYDRMLLKDVA